MTATGTGTGSSLGWDLEPLEIEIDLDEVMRDLDPGWDRAGLEAVAS